MERHQRDDGSTSMALAQSTDDSPQLSARFTAFYTFHLIKINQLINQFH
jgi:glycine cleavage system regulatory protein